MWIWQFEILKFLKDIDSWRYIKISAPKVLLIITWTLSDNFISAEAKCVFLYKVIQWLQILKQYLHTINGLLRNGPQKTWFLLQSRMFGLHFLYLVHFWKSHCEGLLKSLKAIKKSWDDEAFEKIFQKEPLKQMRECEEHM